MTDMPEDILTIRIQPFESRYKDQVIDLILGIQVVEFGIDITAEDQPDLNRIPDFYQSGRGNFWIALSGDMVVGTIALIDIGEGDGALRKMFVREAFRGRRFNIGYRLLDTLLSWSRQQRFRKVFLGTTSQYHAAHRFYEKNGFVEIEKQNLPGTFPVMAVDSKFYRFDLKSDPDAD